MTLSVKSACLELLLKLFKKKDRIYILSTINTQTTVSTEISRLFGDVYIQEYWEVLWWEAMDLTKKANTNMDFETIVNNTLQPITDEIVKSKCDIGNEKLVNSVVSSIVKVLHQLRHHYQLPIDIQQKITRESIYGEDGYSVSEQVVEQCVRHKECVADLIVTKANSFLVNYKDVKCFEGVLLLTLCLPTNYSHYTRHVSTWITVWQNIQHNIHWDCAWLSLFTRMRKHIHTDPACVQLYSQQLLAAVYIKLREVLLIPGVTADIKQLGSGVTRIERHKFDFPYVIPAYYCRLLVLSTDVHKVCVNKMAKLVYYCVWLEKPSADTCTVLMDPCFATPPEISQLAGNVPENIPGNIHPAVLAFHRYPGLTLACSVTRSMSEFILYIQTLRAYVYPSNSGEWTVQLGYFIATLVGELSRHMGRIIGDKVYSATTTATNNPTSVNTLYACSSKIPVIDTLVSTEYTITSMKYLSGNLFPLLLEGLYGKVPFMIQLAGSSLRNICANDPDLGCIFIHYAIRALGTDSINQAHQAPAVLNCLTWLLRQLIAPKPVLVFHLKELMTLTLAGIDSNDVLKTSVALNVYTTIFSWIPLKESYTWDDFIPSVGVHGHEYTYYELMCHGGTTNANTATNQWRHDYASVINTLGGDEMESFCYAFIDKIILLLEARESKQPKPKNGSKQAVSDQGVSESCSLFFNAIQCKTWKIQLLHKILDYILYTAAISLTVSQNAKKDFAKLLEAIVSSDVTSQETSNTNTTTTNTTNTSGNRDGIFSIILFKLLNIEWTTSDVSRQPFISNSNMTILENYTAERLSFILTMVSGCCRHAGQLDVKLYIPVWKQLTNNNKLLYHSDKYVCKAMGKVLRDVFRGMGSVYPIANPIVNSYHTSIIIMNSSNNTVKNVEWNIPSATTLTVIAELLQSTAVTIMSDIRTTFGLIASGNGVQTVDGTGGTYKKVVDKVITSMHHLRRIMRGAAECLGYNVPDPLTKNDVVGSPVLPVHALLNHCLQSQHIQFLCQFRYDYYVFLHQMHHTVMQSELLYALLYTHTGFWKSWLKVTASQIKHGTISRHKGVSKIKKYVRYNIMMYICILVLYIKICYICMYIHYIYLLYYIYTLYTLYVFTLLYIYSIYTIYIYSIIYILYIQILLLS